MKALHYLNLLSTVILGGLVFAACSSDDEDYGEASNEAGIVKTKSGTKRVYRVGDFRFYYNEDGTLNYYDYYNGHEKRQFSYHPDKMVIEDDVFYDMTYTSAGYVAKVDRTEKFSSGSESGTAVFSYDGSSHLTQIAYSSTETYTEDGKEYTEKAKQTVDLTWNKDILTKVVVDERWEEDGEVEKERHTYVFNYDDAEDNAYCQYTYNILSLLDTDFDELGFVGLFGKGPKQLPTSVDVTEDKDDTHTYTFSYRFNDDGTLYYGNGYYYYYDEISASKDDKSTKVPAAPKKASFFSRQFNHRTN